VASVFMNKAIATLQQAMSALPRKATSNATDGMSAKGKPLEHRVERTRGDRRAEPSLHVFAYAHFFKIQRIEKLVPAEGFEPPTTRLRSGCSTAELRRLKPRH
jgi:hypothetical protein